MIYSTQGVPEEHLGSTYDNFDWEGKKLLRQYLEQLIKGTRETGMVFIGKPGVGKTHLMVATYFALQQADVLPGSDVVFFDWQCMLNYLRAGFDLRIRADMAVEKLCSAKYLILDDIKPESQGEFWKQILELIFEFCYNNKTRILLSTNADSRDELVSRWGLMDYHVSRLSHMADIVVLKGKDRRVE